MSDSSEVAEATIVPLQGEEKPAAPPVSTAVQRSPVQHLVGRRRPVDPESPILPLVLRERAAIEAAARLTARRAWWRIRWAALWTLPVVLRLVLRSPWGVARLLGEARNYLYDQQSAALRAAVQSSGGTKASSKEDSDAYSRIQKERRANLAARWRVAGVLVLLLLVPPLAWWFPKALGVAVGLAVFVAVCWAIPKRHLSEIGIAAVVGSAAGYAAYYFAPMLPQPPGWVPWLALFVVLEVLGWVGRPLNRPLVSASGNPADAGIPQKPTREMVVESLCRIGLPTMTMNNLEQVAAECRILHPGVATSAHGYVVELELPPGRTAAEVAGKREELAGAFRRDLGCVWPSGNPDKHPGYLRLFLSHKPMNRGKQPPWPLAVGKPVDIFEPLPLFTDEEARWVNLTIAGTHTVIGGASGFGKSVWLRQLSCALAFDPRVRLVIFDGKRSGDFDHVRKLAHAFHEGAEDHEVAAQLKELRDLIEESLLRAKFLKGLPPEEKSPKVTSALASKYPKHLSPIVFIYDEVQEGTEYGVKTIKEDRLIREEYAGLLTRLARIARSSGIYMVLASQKPDANVIPSAIMGNCSIRAAFKVSEQSHNDQILGTSARRYGIDATKFGSRDKGMAWLKGGDDVDAQVVRSWSQMVDVGLAVDLADKAFDLRQRLGLLTGEAAGEAREDDEVPVDVIADSLSIVDSPAHGGRNISLRMLAEKLRELRPTTWEVDVDAAGALLRAKNVQPALVWCPVEKQTMQGVKREWLLYGDDTDDDATTPPGLSLVR